MRMTVTRFVAATWFLPVHASCGSDPTGPTNQAASGSGCEVVSLLPGARYIHPDDQDIGRYCYPDNRELMNWKKSVEYGPDAEG